MRAGGEKSRVGTKISATRGVASDTKAPQPVDDDCLSVGVTHLVDKLAGGQIVGVDMTVAEISNQQLIGECPETGGRQGHAPRRIELAVLDEAMKRLTTKIEGVGGSGAHSCRIVVFFRILAGLSHN